MNQALHEELQRYGIEIGTHILEKIEIGGTVYEVPNCLQGFLGLLNEGGIRKGPHIFFDRYKEGERFDYNSLSLIVDMGVLEEYDCISTAPYLMIALSGQYANYMIRLDDSKPENPVVYYLGEGEYEEEPGALPAGEGEALRLLELLRKSKPIFD